MTAGTSTDVWAVGLSLTSSAFPAPLAEHWDGTAWTTVPTPDPAGALPELLGISGKSTGPLLAVGDNHDLAANGIYHPFALRGR